MNSRKNISRCFVMLALMVIPTYGCFESEKGPNTEQKEIIVAKVGSKTITLGDLDREIKILKPNFESNANRPKSDSIMKFRKGVLDRIVNDLVLEAEADNQNISILDADLENEIKRLLGDYDKAHVELTLAESGQTFDGWKKSLVRRMKIKELTKRKNSLLPDIPNETLLKYYKENSSDFHLQERAHIFQIMTRDEATVLKVRKMVVRGGDFSEAAKEWSKSPDAPQGGDLGFFAKGQLPPEFEKACFALKEGRISNVVKSIYGYHIFKVAKREKPRKMTFSEAKSIINEIFLSQAREKEFRRWIESLKQKSKIVIYPEVLSSPSSLL